MINSSKQNNKPFNADSLQPQFNDPVGKKKEKSFTMIAEILYFT